MKSLRTWLSVRLAAACILLLSGEPRLIAQNAESSQPWTAPPTRLPPVVVSAIAELFNDGLPDPRGCEYRAIKIPLFPKLAIDTHAWVLPGEKDAPRRAIGWNGGIYPVTEIGAPADVRADFAAREKGRDRQFPGHGNHWPISEPQSLAVDSALAIKVALLLRLGETRLAEETWDAGYAGREKSKAGEVFVDMAQVWLGRWYGQAVRAYLERDDALASTICQGLSPAVAKVTASAGSRG